jgi:hypothetical protein
MDDKYKLAGVGMVNILTNSIPQSITIGISSVLETLVS